jgi:hypothetical protein
MLYTINKPLGFYIDPDLKVPRAYHEDNIKITDEFVSKEVAVMLLEALKLANKYLILRDINCDNLSGVNLITKAINNAEK